jgi:hypothetical protein
MPYIRLILCCLLAIITAGCTSTTSVRHRSNYDFVVNRSHNFVVLPPAVEVNTIDVSNKKTPVHSYGINLESLIKERLVDRLTKSNLRVRILHRKDIAEQGVYPVFLRLQGKYNTVRDELYSPLLWDVKKAFAVEKNIGDDAVLFGEKTDSDILIFVDYLRNIKTNGARIRDFAMGALLKIGDDVPPDSTVMVISFVDAKTGNILWSNMQKYIATLFESSSSEKADIKQLDTIIQLTLQNFKKTN